MALTRTEHWATRELHTFLNEHANDVFEWGTHDCCLFAADAIQAMTGVDIAAEFRGQYDNELDAFKAIKRITGGTSVEDAAVHCANTHGLVEWSHPLLAQRGDLVVINDGSNAIAGIVHLNGRHVVSIGPDGLKRLPASTIKRAWKV